MAVDEKGSFRGRRKRNAKNVAGEISKRAAAFPVNVTVDELYLYRKKKQSFDCLKDNLKIEEGSFKHLKSEYTRRFKNFFDILKSSINGGEKKCLVEVLKPKLVEDQQPKSEYGESFDTQKFDGTANRNHRRPRLLKRPTTLKIEGDFSHVTEHAEQFIQYLLAKRTEICRTPTNLTSGIGEMETKTETADKFRKFDDVERPSLIRKFTNLRLEGESNAKTEKQQEFRGYGIQKRPPLVKKSTNLQLEGSYSLVPEYRDQYVRYENVDRPGPVLPCDNLKTAGLFDDANKTATATAYAYGRTSPSIPFLRESFGIPEDKKSKSNRCRSTVSINRTPSYPNLKKSSSADAKKFSPQRNAYLDHDETLETRRSRSRTRRRPECVEKSENRDSFECQPEYRKAFHDYLIREKPPPGQRRRILEIPDITIEHQTIEAAPIVSEEEKKPQTSRRASKIDTETLRLSPEKKKRVFRRSSTPSPKREHSPIWRRSESNLSSSIWNSTETHPAFFYRKRQSAE